MSRKIEFSNFSSSQAAKHRSSSSEHLNLIDAPRRDIAMCDAINFNRDLDRRATNY
jgi:hypothetical protein